MDKAKKIIRVHLGNTGDFLGEDKSCGAVYLKRGACSSAFCLTINET